MTDFNIRITSEASGNRIDLFLTQKISQFSRSKIQKYIKNGDILVNKKKVKPNWILKKGEYVTGDIQLDITPTLNPENIPINILYEDDYMIIIDKKSGIVVHPGSAINSGTLANSLIYHFKELSHMDTLRPGIIHRLDKETTGVIIIAKSNDIHGKLSKLFQNRKIKKKYKAITWGKVNDQEIISTNICRNRVDRTLFTTSNTRGKNAQTVYNLITYYTPLSYIDVELKTGRTHQIRVHLNSIGHPIICDDSYNGGKERIKSFHSKYSQKLTKVFKHINRVALHAESVEFIHPKSKKKIKVSAPIPEDMNNILLILDEYNRS